MELINVDSFDGSKNLQLKIEDNNKIIFGNGRHSSTQAILKLLSKYNLQNKNIFDIGCGTGILSIAAKKWGANKIYLMDKLNIETLIATNMRNNDVLDYTFYHQNYYNVVKNSSIDFFITNLGNNTFNFIHILPQYVQVSGQYFVCTCPYLLNTHISSLIKVITSLSFKLIDQYLEQTYIALMFEKE